MKEKYYQLAFVIIMMVLITALSLYAWQKPQQTFSETEKRNLTTRQALEGTSLLDGTYQENYETMKNDQFPMREQFVSMHAIFDQLMGNRKSKDVYLGKDALVQDYTPMSAAQMNKMTEAITAFQNAHPDVAMQMMIAPTAIGLSDNALPFGAPRSKQENDIRTFYQKVSPMNCIDLIEPFEKSEDLLYYRSDHHWTSSGAKLAFDTYAKALSLDTGANSYEQLYVKNDFYGTLASKTGIYRYPDEISVYLNQNSDDVYRVTYSDIEASEYTLFDSTKLASDNPYDFFLKGNHPLVQIETASTRRNHLLVIKDSYANALIPFLTPYYSTITIIDPRYYFDSVNALMQEKQITDVLFLYNMTTLSQDTSLIDAPAS